MKLYSVYSINEFIVFNQIGFIYGLFLVISKKNSYFFGFFFIYSLTIPISSLFLYRNSIYCNG